MDILSLLLLFTTAPLSAAPASSTACVHTTLRADGVTQNSVVVVSSGNRTKDESALQLVRFIKFLPSPGGSYVQHSGYVMVGIAQDGVAGQVWVKDSHGTLLDTCEIPNPPERASYNSFKPKPLRGSA